MDMWDVDKDAFTQNVGSSIDMRHGNPAFMHPYWTKHPLDTASLTSDQLNYLDAQLSKKLKMSIIDIHDRFGNANTVDKEVVVGNGAGQVITAAIYALSRKGLDAVYAQAPYFNRFPYYCKFAGTGVNFSNNLPSKNFIQVVTSPNNPDGKWGNVKCGQASAIYDLCYNWPQYKNTLLFDEDIMVFGLAKATAHASSRIGWALVKDSIVAEDMRHFIKMTTSGVSAEAQITARMALDRQYIIPYDKTCFKYGQDVLATRWKTLVEIHSQRTDFTILNTEGMFAWGKLKEGNDSESYFKDKLNTLVLPGTIFGMSTNAYFRLNLGCEDDRFDQFIENLRKLSGKA